MVDDSIYSIDASKPREERDYKEIYPDLSDTTQLPLFVVHESTGDLDPKITSGSTTHFKKPRFQKLGQIKFTNTPRFTKMAMSYGYQDPMKPALKNQQTYIRPYSLPHNETVTDFANKKAQLVEYDLDEQDILYINDRNNKASNTIKLSYEVFEILMTILEKLWNKLEWEISLTEAESTNGLKSTEFKLRNNDEYGEDDGIIQGSVEDQRCAVCNDSDCDNINAIVFCDGCNIAVHQECYGIAFIPEGQWFCRKCMINKNRHVNCIFCPSTTGAFKQLDSSLWSHVVCALWINELYFANPVYLEPIEGVDSIPKNRWKLVCYICKQRMGACIQCHNKNCFQAYHVTCAKRAGLFMQFTRGIQGAIHNKATLRTYCDKHGPANWDQITVMQKIAKTRKYFKDLNILNVKTAKFLKKQETDNKLNVFKWKTENDTPIPPHFFADHLFNTLLDLKLDSYQPLITSDFNLTKDLGISANSSKLERRQELRNLSFDICKYWCLKREAKNGAPLCRQNNNMELSPIVYGSNDMQEINDKKKLGQILLHDLDKIISISGNVLDRQKLSLAKAEINHEIFALVYATKNEWYKQLVIQIENLDPNKLLFNSKIINRIWNEIKSKVETYEYSKINEMMEDIQLMCNKIYEEYKPNTSIYKLSKRIDKTILNKDWNIEELEIEKNCGNGKLELPFLVSGVNGEVEFTSHNVEQELKAEDLSEVEALDEYQETLLMKFYQES